MNNGKKRGSPQRLTAAGQIKESIKTLPERAVIWAVKQYRKIKAVLAGISVDKRDIYRALICTGLVIFAALTETTFFGYFRPFGATPDLVLPLVIAIGMTEGGTWGGAFGIVGGLVINSLGSVGMTPTPLVFCLAGFFAGLLLEEYFSDMIAVRGLMIFGGAVLRAVMTLIAAASDVPDFKLGEVFALVVGPEFLSTLALSPLPHVAAYLTLRWAHKSRTELTE